MLAKASLLVGAALLEKTVNETQLVEGLRVNLQSMQRQIDVDFSGLPCEDNSKANHKRKFFEGRFNGCYLSWSKYHKTMGTPLLILENTPDIKSNEIEQLFMPEYRMLQLFVTPEDVGHSGVARARTYIYLYDWRKLEYLHDVFELYSNISKEIRKVARTQPEDYMVSTALTRAADEMHMARTRKKVYQHANPSVEYLLNERELLLVRQLDFAYISKFHRHPALDPGLVYFLGDNASFSRTWSASSRALPTFRKNTGKYLFRRGMKFLTGQEKLAALGWPVNQGLAEEMMTTVMPSIDPTRSHFLAGNSMHLTNATVVLMVGLSCFGPVKESHS
ncbi:unnamed protein product [Effrenium voratum]|nr:unnamed protein product [Effrenium voratum]